MMTVLITFLFMLFLIFPSKKAFERRVELLKKLGKKNDRN